MSFSKKYLEIVYYFWAKIYDRIIDSLFKFNREKVIKELKILKNDKILEVGVGTGLNLPFYPKNCEVTGIDFSKAMLEKARNKNYKAKLRLVDARKLPFPDNYFDKAVTTYVLRVSPEPKKILKEVSRVVKNNGLFVILDQFKGKNRLILSIIQPFKLLLGWGKDYNIKKLIFDTSWQIVSNKKFGIMNNTRLIVLKNKKL